MACPRCGCRMLTSTGSGKTAQLVCSDCGLPQRTPTAGRHAGAFSQLTSGLLMAFAALTAVGLMVIKDRQASGLLNEGLQQVRGESAGSGSSRRRDLIVVPRLPSRRMD